MAGKFFSKSLDQLIIRLSKFIIFSLSLSLSLSLIKSYNYWRKKTKIDNLLLIGNSIEARDYLWNQSRVDWISS
jgi:hypothetical protein